MTIQTIMAELKAKGSEATKKVLLKHGIKEPFFGVKVADLKPIQKKIKKDYQLSKELYATGNADAMYLAGLIADETKMTKADLTTWVKQATSSNISDYTVPWIASESNFGFELGMKWIDDKNETIAASGWFTLANLVTLKPDAELDIATFSKLLKRIEKEVHRSPNRVKRGMNSFLISLGAYVLPLSADTIAASKKIGDIEIDMGDTSCKVPNAVEYINKAKARGSLGKKKKMARC